jgi:ferritin-like metal-binding protein YciE
MSPSENSAPRQVVSARQMEEEKATDKKLTQMAEASINQRAA